MKMAKPHAIRRGVLGVRVSAANGLNELLGIHTRQHVDHPRHYSKREDNAKTARARSRTSDVAGALPFAGRQRIKPFHVACIAIKLFLFVAPSVNCALAMRRYCFAPCAPERFFFRRTFRNQCNQNQWQSHRCHDDYRYRFRGEIHLIA